MTAGAIAIVVSFGVAAPAAAQGLNYSRLSGERPNVIHLNTGLDHGFAAGLGYRRHMEAFDHRLLLFADVAMPWARPGISDYRLNAGAALPVLELGSWKLVGSLSPLLRGVSNENVRMTNMGVRAGVTMGYYRSWFVVAELGLDWAITTHLQHTDAFRRTYYSGVRDGWYANTGVRFDVGVHGGYSFSRFDVIARLSQSRDFDGQTPLLPFVFTLGVNVYL